MKNCFYNVNRLQGSKCRLMKTKETSQCALCGIDLSKRACRSPGGLAPPFCPTRNHADLQHDSFQEYGKTLIRKLAKEAAIQEGEGYTNREQSYLNLRPVKSRLEEIIEFSRRMNYQHLGLAFCVGLRSEAKVVAMLLKDKGFRVSSVICKVGNIDKNLIGVQDDQKIVCDQAEAMCNPILQADIFNQEQTEFNILLGLCVGHDSLFFQYAQAPCTVFAVKDRLLGHNPLAAVYTLDSYYRALKS